MTQGRRFPNCQDYRKCLYHAALMERDFICKGCSSYQPTERQYLPHEKAGMQALLRAIFSREVDPVRRYLKAREIHSAEI